MDPIIPTPSPTTGTPAAPNGAADEEAPVGVTVEERDAYWQKRMSGKDRAHAAAERTLREELESLRAKASATPGANGQPGTGDPNAAEVERLTRELAARDTLYGRKAKYPNLNGNVSDTTIMASDEADLAKFNALYDNDSAGGTFIAPTAPKRTASPGSKRIEDMSKDELLVALQRETDRMREDKSA